MLVYFSPKPKEYAKTDLINAFFYFLFENLYRRKLYFIDFIKIVFSFFFNFHFLFN